MAQFYARLATAATVLALAAAPVAQADTVLWVAGTRGPSWMVPSGTTSSGHSFYNSAFAGDTWVTVPYPAAAGPLTGLTDPSLGSSVKTGVASLDTLVHNTNDHLIIAGVSQGALVIDQEQAALNDDPSVPSSTEFVVAGDPGRPGGILSWLPAGTYIPFLNYTAPGKVPETRFQTVVIVNQYDGWADFPQNPLNLLADLNALMGMYYNHPSEGYDMQGAVVTSSTTNSQGGTTTTYLVPSKYLPLTMPLRQLGVPGFIVNAIDSFLRPIIDSAYNRHFTTTPAPVVPTRVRAVPPTHQKEPADADPPRPSRQPGHPRVAHPVAERPARPAGVDRPSAPRRQPGAHRPGAVGAGDGPVSHPRHTRHGGDDA